MNEVWKDVKGYEGIYQVSNLGRVKSMPRRIKRTNGFWNTQGKIMTVNIDKGGYHRVGLNKEGKRKYFSVHRLVAISFLENHENKEEVNHKDGNKDNNEANNLEWMSRSENMKHAVDNKLVTHLFEESSKMKKKIYQFDKAGRLINEFSSLGEASEVTGISKTYISQLCTGARKVQAHHKFLFSHNYWAFAEEVTE